MENMTIKHRAAGFGLECPGDGMVTLLLEGGNQSISTVSLDATSQRHHNQLATALARAETAGEWLGGFAFRRGELMYFRHSGGR